MIYLSSIENTPIKGQRDEAFGYQDFTAIHFIVDAHAVCWADKCALITESF